MAETKKEKIKFKDRFKRISWGYLFISMLALAMSAIFFVFGIAAVENIAIAIGVAVIFFASLLAVLAIADKQRGTSFGFKIAMAVCLLVSGIVVLIARNSAMSVIISVLALVMIIDGSFKLHAAAISKRKKSRVWWTFLVLSIFLIACGYYAVSFPGLDPDFPTSLYILASALFVDAVSNLLSLFFKSKISE